MAKAIACEEFELNTLIDDAHSITIAEEAMNAENSEDDCPRIASPKTGIDAEIEMFYADLSELLENNLNLDTVELEVWADYGAKETAEDANLAIKKGEFLMDLMSKNIEFLRKKATEYFKKGRKANNFVIDGICDNVTHFYIKLVYKYKNSIKSLKERIRMLEIVLQSLKEWREECTKIAAPSAQVTDETSDESRKIVLSTCDRNNKGISITIVALKKERKALRKVMNIYKFVKRKEAMEKRIQRTMTKAIKDRKTTITYVVFTIFGFSLILIAFFFEVGSQLFRMCLILGLMLAVPSTIHWCFTLYEYLTGKEIVTETKVSPERHAKFPGFCKNHLKIIEDCLLTYDVNLEYESE